MRHDGINKFGYKDSGYDFTGKEKGVKEKGTSQELAREGPRSREGPAVECHLEEEREGLRRDKEDEERSELAGHKC